MANKPKRTVDGRLEPGQGSLNPGGRSKVIREALDEFRRTDDLRRLRLRLIELAEGDDGKVAVSAIREYHDRAFGKAPQAITGEDGGPIKLDTDLASMIARLGGKSG